jgi:hypothetical protein
MLGAPLLMAGASKPPSPLLIDLCGYWRLDGNALDAHGTNHGTVVGSGWSWVAGKLGQCGEVVNNTGAVDVGGDPSIKPTQAITVAAWLYFYGPVGANARLLSDWHQDVSKDRWILGYSPDGVTLYGHMNTNILVGTIGGTIPTNQWVHVALTAYTQGAFNPMTTYVNGVQVAAVNGSGLYRNAPGTVRIGRQAETGAGMNGRIDEVGIWRRALSAAEIAQLYNAGSGRAYPFD